MEYPIKLKRAVAPRLADSAVLAAAAGLGMEGGGGGGTAPDPNQAPFTPGARSIPPPQQGHFTVISSI